MVVIILPGPFVKLPFILERLLLPAFVAAQFVPEALCQEEFSAHLALPEIQPPVAQAVQVVGDKGQEGIIGRHALHPA